jgi:hypothetical protein
MESACYLPEPQDNNTMLTKTQSTETKSDITPIEKKPFFDRILGSTPVILTVIATILAGMSSSEMTQAQYHRSLAAQSQSKAGDQWSFFQAKRIRGMSLQTTIDLLQAVSGSTRVDPAFLQAAAGQLVASLDSANKESAQLEARLKDAMTKLGPAGDRFSQAVARLSQLASARSQEARTQADDLDKELGKSETQQAFAYLTSENLPAPETREGHDGQVAEAMKAVGERRPEDQIRDLLRSVKPEQVEQGIQTAELNALAVERANKPVNSSLDKLAQIMQNLTRIAREVQRGARDLARAAKTAKAGPEIDAAANLVVQTCNEARESMDEANNDLKVAEYTYMVRRYRSEADANQNAADAYEVQVRKSSLTSENHRDRSKNFFYGMLIAQAGVTIATFSLALRFRSALWSLATLAGIIALAIAVRVYLFM